MAVSYTEREQQELDKAAKVIADYTASRKQNTTDYLNGINQSIDTTTDSTKAAYETQKSAIPEQYKSVFDANAVQQIVNQRQLAERVANMGLTDSGLNRTQQTAITVQRGNADAKARTQQQAAVDSVNTSIAKIIAEANASKQSAAATAWANSNSDILSTSENLRNSAKTNAANIYNTDITAEQAEKNRIAEQQQKANELAWKAEQSRLDREASANTANTTARNTLIKAIMDASGATYEQAVAALDGKLATGKVLSNNPLTATTKSSATSNNSISQDTYNRADTKTSNVVSAKSSASKSNSSSNSNISNLIDNTNLYVSPAQVGSSYKFQISNGKISKSAALDAILDKYEGQANDDTLILTAAESAGLSSELKARIRN